MINLLSVLPGKLLKCQIYSFSIRQLFINRMIRQVNIKDGDIESAARDGLSVSFASHCTKVPQAVGSMLSRINIMKSEVAVLKAARMFEKYVCALQDLNSKIRLEYHPTISHAVRRKLTRLRKEYRSFCPYLDDYDTPSMTQYKLQKLKDKWLSMPVDLRQRFDLLYRPSFYGEISTALVSHKPGGGEGHSVVKLPPSLAAKADKWDERWWSF